MAECTRASYHDTMPTPTSRPSGFKKQVVFRISVAEWPLLEQAAQEHGSIQAAILAGLHALSAAEPRTTMARVAAAASTEAGPTGAEAEVTARAAARILGLKPDTVSSYIRCGRLPGHYRDTLGSTGWVTSQAAVLAYRERIRASR